MDFVFRSGAQLSFLTVASPSRNFTLWTSLAVFLWVTPQADPETSIWVKWFTWDLVPGSIAWWVWGVSKTNSGTGSYRDLLETVWGTSLDCSAAGWGADCLSPGSHPLLTEGCSWGFNSMGLPGSLYLDRGNSSSQRDIGSHMDALQWARRNWLGDWMHLLGFPMLIHGAAVKIKWLMMKWCSVRQEPDP